MIENGVKYGMMNGVKGHPLGPSFAVAAAGLHRRHTAAGAPRGTRNYSTAAASSSPTRACFPPACPSSLLLSQPSLVKLAGLSSLHFGRQPQHSSYELVPADVAHCIRFNSKVFAGTPQQALLKAYEEAATEEE